MHTDICTWYKPSLMLPEDVQDTGVRAAQVHIPNQECR